MTPPPRTEEARWWAPRRWWRRTLHNLPQKLAALVVAMLVWLLATADRRANIEVGFDVPLQVRDTTGGAGRRAVSNLPASVRVTLGGQRARLQGLPPTAIEASVDATNVPEGSFDLPVEVRAPDGTSTRRVVPGRVQGFVDSQLSRRLTITLSVAAPPPGALPRYTLNPEQVQVSGPSRLVRTVTRVITEPLELSAGAAGRTRLVALNTRGEPVTGVQLQPPGVALRRSDVGSLPVRTLPVLLPPAPARLRVQGGVSPASIRVVGPPGVLATLNSVTPLLTYKPGIISGPARFKLPPGVQPLDTVQLNLKVTSRP